MRTGRLRHDLAIYKLSGTSDAYGATDNSYTLFKTVKARLGIRSTREGPMGPDRVSKVEYKISVRYRDFIATLPNTAEVVIEGKRLKVLAVTDPKGMRRDLDIYAEDIS